eukprot:1911891-Pleurochrysis_carterae.AAC.1
MLIWRTVCDRCPLPPSGGARSAGARRTTLYTAFLMSAANDLPLSTGKKCHGVPIACTIWSEIAC